MSGTREGGLKAAIVVRSKYGHDFYQKIGTKGGQTKGLKKGFACLKKDKDGLTGPERAVKAGQVGGKYSPKQVSHQSRRKYKFKF